MNARLLSISVIAVGTFFLAGYFFTSRVNSDERVVGVSADVALLQSKIDALGNEIERLKRENQSLNPHLSSDSATPKGNDLSPPLQDETSQGKIEPRTPTPPEAAPKAASVAQQEPLSEADEERYLQTVSAGYDSALASEELDQQWATSEESGFRDRLRTNAPPGTDLGNIACRSTLCRVVLNHSTDDAKEQLMSSLHSVVGARQSQVFYRYVYNPGGTVSTILYVSRDGERLPKVQR